MAFSIKYLGIQETNNGKHFTWLVTINGENIQYKTGLGHVQFVKFTNSESKPKVPRLRDILYALAQDAQSGLELFQDFCDNLGYDSDSRKALAIYEACQENALKLRKIMIKSENYLERIIAWEL